MKVSPIEEYGLRCLLTLARTRPTPWSIDAIARREGLTRAYVAKIVMLLRKSGLVTSTRGRSGGIRLTRAPGTITAAQALQALDGPLYRATACDGFAQGSSCDLSFCSIRNLWTEISDSVNHVLENTTLQDLLAAETRSEPCSGACCRETDPSAAVPGTLAD